MWRRVSSIVSRTRPPYPYADRSSFCEYELRIRLSDAIAVRVVGQTGVGEKLLGVRHTETADAAADRAAGVVARPPIQW